MRAKGREEQRRGQGEDERTERALGVGGVLGGVARGRLGSALRRRRRQLFQGDLLVVVHRRGRLVDRRQRGVFDLC